MQIAALVKQIPVFEDMQLGSDGRLQREGLTLHLNDYCRRAVNKGIELAGATGGTLTVITLGPPSAENALREALACGADSAVHICDPAFAGSDTLATAKALAAAITPLGPFDLILCGRNSVDADTGQVPPQIAELLGLPFAAGAKEIEVCGMTLRLGLEHDDEWVDAEVDLPALVSCAERLCDPCKLKDPDIWAAVDGTLITTVDAATLGPGPWGQQASPTSVGAISAVEVSRDRIRLKPSDIDGMVALLERRGALSESPVDEITEVPDSGGVDSGDAIGVVVEPARERVTRELLGAAAQLAEQTEGHVVAIGPELGDAATLQSWGADAAICLKSALVESDVSAQLSDWMRDTTPWAILAPGTAWGREVASRLAAATGSGLTGDAIGLSVRDRRLVAQKSAFGNATVAEILCSSPTQMATVRPGVLPLLCPRADAPLGVSEVTGSPGTALRVSLRRREDNSDELANARVVIGVGQGVAPELYPELHAAAEQLGAALCATRKVTDNGWMPRARQVGITGHTITPRLYIAIGTSGKFNHTVGVRSSGTIVGINPDPDAPLFDCCDLAVVGDWRAVFAGLIPALSAS